MARCSSASASASLATTDRTARATSSRGAASRSRPLATFDLLSDEYAALSLLGALNIGSLGESETCGNGPGGAMTCVQSDDDAFGFGLTLGAGIRGMITQGLALGGEFGWGFLSIAADPAGDTFVHGIFGNLTLEASVGI